MEKKLTDFTEGHSFNRYNAQYERGKLYASFNNSVSNKLQLEKLVNPRFATRETSTDLRSRSKAFLTNFANSPFHCITEPDKKVSPSRSK